MNTSQAVGVGSVVLTLMTAAPVVVADQDSRAQTGQPAQDERTYRSGAESGMSGSGLTGGSQANASIDADDIDDTNVVNSAGDKIGEVERVVRSIQDNRLYAVISVGGFLGVGDKEVAIPLKELQMRNDKLWAPLTASTQEQLKSHPEYDESRYKEVSDDQQIDRSDFAAFEPD